MNINTKYHGIKQYNEEDIITFKKGLPGFENLTKFILFPIEDVAVFNILHSIENEEIGLIVTSPFNIDKNYEINLSFDLTEELEIEKETDVLLLNTVTLNSKLENITVNMKAPIILNIVKGQGRQIILDDGKYLLKHPLVQEG